MADCLSHPILGDSYFSILGACSGHGQCINNTCVCNSGWTGKSDFINADGIDCQINTKVVRGLWIAAFIWVNCIYIFTFPKVRLRWKQHRELVARKKARGKTYYAWENSSLVSMFVYFSICALGFELYSLLKIFDFDDKERVGLTPIATTLFFLTVVGFYAAFFFFQPPLMSVLLRGGKNYRFLIKANYWIALSGLVMQLIDAALPFFLLKEKGEINQKSKSLFISFFAINVLALLGYTVQAGVTMRRSTKILAISYQLHGRSWILDIKKKIGNVQKQTLIECALQGLIYIIFIAWTFMWTKHDYFLPVSWAFATVLWFRIFNAVVESNTKAAEKTTPMSSRPGLDTEAGWNSHHNPRHNNNNNNQQHHGRQSSKRNPSPDSFIFTSVAAVPSDASHPQTEEFESESESTSGNFGFI